MAVYTHLGAEQLAELIAFYDVGELQSAKGIAEGVSNSNWLIETSGTNGNGARFILTMYERRIDLADLPFFLGLLDHLALHGCPVPRTIHDRQGASCRMVGDKAVALIEFLPGVSIDEPTAEQAKAVGRALAQMHMAALDFPMSRPNTLGIGASLAMLERCGDAALGGIDPGLPAVLQLATRIHEDWPRELPTSIAHTDLFPDNVLMLGSRVSALIDFYFACSDAMAYDLAVTHAAWSFGAEGHQFDAKIGKALVDGYESLRMLSASERDALPLLAKGACLRFIASRAEDWIDTPPGALVARKDPMDFVRRLEFYAEAGPAAFA